jgi:glycine cleavage system aminomethyltransferase T
MNPSDAFVDILRASGAALRDTPWGPVAVDFGDWQAEYRALRQAAGLFRAPAAAQVEIRGNDRAAFLNRLSTNKLDDLQPGEGRETFLADANGRIMHYVYVFAGLQSLVLHTAPGLGPSLIAHLDHYWIREDLQFIDRSAEWGQLVLMGPQAADIIARITRADLPQSDAYVSHVEVLWHDRPLMVRSFQERGFTAFHLVGDVAYMASLWQALGQSGAKACGVRA